VTEEPAKFTREQHDLLIAHYERVAPLLTASFAGTPLVAGFVHDWATRTMTFEMSLTHPPASIPTVQVPLHSGSGMFAAVAENTVMWQAHRGAVSFFGWSPTQSEPHVRRLRARAAGAVRPGNNGDGEGGSANDSRVA
jgi:hypothetical protein